MTIYDIITDILETLYDLIVIPINEVLLRNWGISLNDFSLRLGFGSVEWFDIPLDNLLLIFLGVFLGFILLRLIYRFIKWLFRLGKGLVGIR
jgi:hypothetical protein